MLKKFVIPGLVLLFAGAAVLGWLLFEKEKEQQQTAYYKSKYGSEPDQYIKQYTQWLQLPPEQRAYLPWGLDKNGKPKTDEQLQQEQQERLKADIDKLTAGKTDTFPFADILYGPNWQEEITKYKKQKNQRENILTGSILCMFTGGAILSCGLLSWIGHKVSNASSRLKKSVESSPGKRRRKNDNNPALSNTKEKTEPKNKDKGIVTTKTKAGIGARAETKNRTLAEKLSGISANAKEDVREKHQPKRDTAKVAKTSAQKDKQTKEPEKNIKHSQVLKNSDFKSGEKYSAGRDKMDKPQKTTSINTGTGIKNSAKKDEESDGIHSGEKKPKLVNSLDDEVENVNPNQILEDSLKLKNAIDHSQPINSTLNELTQEVSAIREYAASQQDRLNKLQDGYDWNIMRTFCLRFIRCIDNIDRRITQLTEQGIDLGGLEDVRDELLFALESSGVEQFEPEINSDYHGQEKYAEAVKEKENCKDPKRAGKIAKVIRPAYQYFIDEENAKVVRPAQVKLFG